MIQIKRSQQDYSLEKLSLRNKNYKYTADGQSANLPILVNKDGSHRTNIVRCKCVLFL